MSVRPLWAWVALLVLDARFLPRDSLAASPPIHVDDFESTAAWSTVPADGVNMKLSSDTGASGKALRIDFDFAKGGGYAVARREVDLTLPDRYAFVVKLRGECRVNNLELKLVDSTGANVWWCNRRDFEFPRQWTTLTTRKRQITFAWGPIGGGEIRRVKAIEFAITAGQGGKGSVWLDQLELRELPPPSDQVPKAQASSSIRGHEPEKALDGDAKSSWSSGEKDRLPWVRLDFGGERELGGLVLDWAPGRHPPRYVVEAPEGEGWRTLRAVEGNGGRDFVALPETDASALRIRATEPSGGCALFEARVQPLDWAATYEKFFQAVAQDAPRGNYPRAIAGEQSYWTVVGLDHDTQEALVGEDGAIEAGKRGFSLEPFLVLGGHLKTWADVRITRRLEEGVLPIPTVRWEVDSLALEITAFATGQVEGSSVIARYRLTNQTPTARSVKLYLALRPFQVNPPAQFLNTAGGVSKIHSLTLEDRAVRVDRDRGVMLLTKPDGFGAATFDQGNVVDWLRHDGLPPATTVQDSFGFASGAMAYRLDLDPGATREVDLLIPLHSRRSMGLMPSAPGQEFADTERAFQVARREWGQALGKVSIELPDSAAAIAEAVRAQVGFIMVNRDGPAIQPGSRAYERSWIRDGSLTCSALLRMGHPSMVREFIEWFGPNQYDNGKIPCCVDTRGADPVPEHDSHGEFIYLIAEYHRFTGDRASVERWWPRVAKAAAYLDTLRAQRRTPEYQTPEKREFFGLLPPSISHEGYSAKPMHSYWDDLFALRGYRDAAYLAEVLGKNSERARLERSGNEFFRDLNASIDLAMKKHKIPYIPGCADLGDYDATSTTIALSPVQAWPASDARLKQTFEGYWEWFTKRRGGEPWDAYTPYEWRIVGAFVRLGQRARAQQALDWFFRDRRPPGFPQWPEVVFRDERAPHFIGDMPHTWCGSDFVRSVLDMLAYEREGAKSGEQLVIGAGVPDAWLRGSGVKVGGLRTRYGPLDLSLRRSGEEIEARIAGVKPPAGGVILDLDTPKDWIATVDGKSAPILEGGEIRITKVPAVVKLSAKSAKAR